MTSPPSISDLPPAGSDAVRPEEVLDPRILKWIFHQGWSTLRDVQALALPVILARQRDAVLCATTAAGKTEAAFLPILSDLVGPGRGGLVLYLSPLKALINDQFRRLLPLCEQLDVPVTAWHGDASQSRKQALVLAPRGIVLITPESIEALLIRGLARTLFQALRFVVIDEMHVFMQSDRGAQMLSLLARIDQVTPHPAPRIGLSATLGEPAQAATYIRPGGQALIIDVPGHLELRCQVRAYPRQTQDADGSPLLDQDLYTHTHGTHSLIFANTRRNVERYAASLAQLCEAERAPNTYYPHHGQLSAEQRNAAELAIRDPRRPASVVCTTTLELGIDVGDLDCIAQIGPPPSVSSLRQRLGRSGRRHGEASILRGYCLEFPDSPNGSRDAPIATLLHESLLQFVAAVRLLLAGWCEPTRDLDPRYGVLVHQILSILLERNGAKAADLYAALITARTPWNLSSPAFAELLHHLGREALIEQAADGTLLLGARGERETARWDFFAVFSATTEWTVKLGNALLGSATLPGILSPGQGIQAFGEAWIVARVDSVHRVLNVLPEHRKILLPEQGRGLVHARIRDEMRAILVGRETLPFLDRVAAEMIQTARHHADRYKLLRPCILFSGSSAELLTWADDRCNNAMTQWLRSCGVPGAISCGLSIRVPHAKDLLQALARLSTATESEMHNSLSQCTQLGDGKWDWAVPLSWQIGAVSASQLDFAKAQYIAGELIKA